MIVTKLAKRQVQFTEFGVLWTITQRFKMVSKMFAQTVLWPLDPIYPGLFNGKPVAMEIDASEDHAYRSLMKVYTFYTTHFLRVRAGVNIFVGAGARVIFGSARV